ncbi:NADH:flavin oxidoreductase/NADH oxidase [Chytriomyces cf. hyalinus JEL632]|nr:NADH:flavin oxidoreductase/NADH oxidase [Chytriomyces cf. hyalinus JEL632]
MAPSAIKQASTTADVEELDVEGIAQIVASFEKAAELSLAAGFDVFSWCPSFSKFKFFGVHGYLIHSFLSPLSNKRTDAYGGPLENRMRLALEVTRAVRAKWPETKPLFFRLSASDFVDGGLTIDESVIVCRELKELGVDVVDCSSMGIVAPMYASIPLQPGYNVPLAQKIRHESSLATAAVGLSTEAAQAAAILQDGSADVVLLARAFLNDPSWVLNAAAELGAEVEWPLQYRRGKPRI